jgi:ABC-type transporter Mla subunit MlaD
VESADYLIIITAVCLIALISVLIPTLIQIKRTAKKAETFTDQLNTNLQPVLDNITETSTELQNLSISIRDKIDRTGIILDTTQDASRSLLNTVDLLQETVTPIISQLAGISAGIKAFSSFFIKTEKKERRYFDE